MGRLAVELPPATISDREVSSKELLALRIKAVSEAWRHQDEALLRSELAQLGREASLLSRSVPLKGLQRRQELAIEAGEEAWQPHGGRPRSYRV